MPLIRPFRRVKYIYIGHAKISRVKPHNPKMRPTTYFTTFRWSTILDYKQGTYMPLDCHLFSPSRLTFNQKPYIQHRPVFDTKISPHARQFGYIFNANYYKRRKKSKNCSPNPLQQRPPKTNAKIRIQLNRTNLDSRVHRNMLRR